MSRPWPIGLEAKYFENTRQNNFEGLVGVEPHNLL